MDTAERIRALLTHNHVIEKLHVDRFRRRINHPRHLHVRRTRRRIARWVIVHTDKPRRARHQIFNRAVLIALSCVLRPIRQPCVFDR